MAQARLVLVFGAFGFPPRQPWYSNMAIRSSDAQAMIDTAVRTCEHADIKDAEILRYWGEAIMPRYVLLKHIVESQGEIMRFATEQAWQQRYFRSSHMCPPRLPQHTAACSTPLG